MSTGSSLTHDARFKYHMACGTTNPLILKGKFPKNIDFNSKIIEFQPWKMTWRMFPLKRTSKELSWDLQMCHFHGGLHKAQLLRDLNDCSGRLGRCSAGCCSWWKKGSTLRILAGSATSECARLSNLNRCALTTQAALVALPRNWVHA